MIVFMFELFLSDEIADGAFPVGVARLHKIQAFFFKIIFTAMSPHW